MESQKKEKKRLIFQGIVGKWKSLSRKKKIFVVILGFTFVILMSVVAGKLGGDETSVLHVKAGIAEYKNLRQEVVVKGTVSGTDSANVYSSANYRISNILVKEGDSVIEGQVLAELDAENARNQYNQAVIAAAEAKRAYDTATALYSEGAISKSEFLSAQSASNTANLVLQSYGIDEVSNVTSPIAGTVTRVNTSVGKLANGSSSEALFVVENLEKLQMKVNISEYDISKIKIGQTAIISAEVLGQGTVEGFVSAISPTGEAKAVGSSEMVIPIVIDIDHKETSLIAGVTAKAVILTNVAENALTVPIDAIIEDVISGETSVFRIADGLLVKVPVNVLLEGNFDVAISGDISEGDSVVLVPTFDMADGMAVIVD